MINCVALLPLPQFCVTARLLDPSSFLPFASHSDSFPACNHINERRLRSLAPLFSVLSTIFDSTSSWFMNALRFRSSRLHLMLFMYLSFLVIVGAESRSFMSIGHDWS